MTVHRVGPWIGCVAVLLVSSGCSSGIGRPVHEITAEIGAGGVQHVSITAHSFWFEPNRIVVKADVPVELELRNNSLIVPHNFSCSSPAEGLELDAGLGMLKRGNTVTFTATRPGEYRFFCDKDSHAAKGMTGTIVVVR